MSTVAAQHCAGPTMPANVFVDNSCQASLGPFLLRRLALSGACARARDKRMPKYWQNKVAATKRGPLSSSLPCAEMSSRRFSPGLSLEILLLLLLGFAFASGCVRGTSWPLFLQHDETLLQRESDPPCPCPHDDPTTVQKRHCCWLHTCDRMRTSKGR